MASLSIPNSFSNGTAADAVQVNANFNAVKSYVESALVQTDGSVKATTASLDDAIVTTAKLATGAVTDAKASLTSASGVLKVYASTAARDAAITSPTAGMVVYVNSDDSSEGLYTYTGSSWNKGPGWNAPWGLVTPVVKNTTTDSAINATEKAAVTSASFTAVANRNYKITYIEPQYGVNVMSGANYVLQAIRLTSTSGTTLYLTSNVGVSLYEPMTVVTTLTAGSTVVLGTLKTDAGTGTATRSSVTYAQLIIEDIGPAGAPA